MKKKKSPTKIIEEVKKPWKESFFAKLYGGELFHASLFRTKNAVWEDIFKINERASKENQPYVDVHTHPDFPLPSKDDFKDFLKNKRTKKMMVAQRDGKSGKVKGYFVVGKTRKTPVFPDRKKRRILSKNIKHYNLDYIDMNSFDEVEKVVGDYNLKYKFVPAEGYIVNRFKTHFVKGKKQLENRFFFIASGISFLASFLFLSTAITGNVVGNQNVSNGVGALLFVFGLVGGFVYFNKGGRNEKAKC